MWKWGKYLVCLLLLVVGVTSCYYRTALPIRVDGEGEEGEEESSVVDLPERPYALNSNFKVTADTLWLHQLPFTDSLPVLKDNELVVAELAIHADDPTDSVWVKVARDQETIGWLPEHQLLENIVPVDPISQCIHLFSDTHTLYFFLIVGIFFLTFAYRAMKRKKTKLIWLNDIDSIFPIMLSWLLACVATLYNSMQYFVPQTWERYYYDPSLNPFDLPLILGLFVLSVWCIFLMGVALLDDLFHQTTFEVAFFYLIGLASCCIFLYIFFTYLWIYAAYVCLIAYTYCCFRWLKHSNRYPYACGACGAKMRAKGICPHCGALNE